MATPPLSAHEAILMTQRAKLDKAFVRMQAERMTHLIQQRAALPREDLEYLVERVAKLKDVRLQMCVAELVGWSDDTRAEIETFVAIAIELMKNASVSSLRSATRIVELRYLVRSKDENRIRNDLI